jgi:hypothetical protein
LGIPGFLPILSILDNSSIHGCEQSCEPLQKGERLSLDLQSRQFLANPPCLPIPYLYSLPWDQQGCHLDVPHYEPRRAIHRSFSIRGFIHMHAPLQMAGEGGCIASSWLSSCHFSVYHSPRFFIRTSSGGAAVR